MEMNGILAVSGTTGPWSQPVDDRRNIRQNRDSDGDEWHIGRQWDRGPSCAKYSRASNPSSIQHRAVRKWDHGPSPSLTAVISVRTEARLKMNGTPSGLIKTWGCQGSDHRYIDILPALKDGDSCSVQTEA